LLAPLPDDLDAFGRRPLDEGERRIGRGVKIDGDSRVSRQSQLGAGPDSRCVGATEQEDVRLALEIVAGDRVVVAGLGEAKYFLQILRRIAAFTSANGAGERELRLPNVAAGIGSRIAGRSILCQEGRRDDAQRGGSSGESLHKTSHQ
jgi:hypothetical protein